MCDYVRAVTINSKGPGIKYLGSAPLSLGLISRLYFSGPLYRTHNDNSDFLLLRKTLDCVCLLQTSLLLTESSE